MTDDTGFRQYVPAPVGGAVSVVRAVGALAADRSLTYLAAGITFYAFVSAS